MWATGEISDSSSGQSFRAAIRTGPGAFRALFKIPFDYYGNLLGIFHQVIHLLLVRQLRSRKEFWMDNSRQGFRFAFSLKPFLKPEFVFCLQTPVSVYGPNVAREIPGQTVEIFDLE